MKTTKVLYWIFTALFAALMLFTAIPDIMQVPDAITFMNGHLQYPIYIIPFISWAKVIGVIVILIPFGGNIGYRIKEWAYAGLAFDLIGAIYSIIAVDGLHASEAFMLIWVVMGCCSYIFYHKKIKS